MKTQIVRVGIRHFVLAKKIFKNRIFIYLLKEIILVPLILAGRVCESTLPLLNSVIYMLSWTLLSICIMLFFIAITLHYNSFNPSFYFNYVMGVENGREEGVRQSNGKSSFNLSMACWGQKNPRVYSNNSEAWELLTLWWIGGACAGTGSSGGHGVRKGLQNQVSYSSF